MFIKRDLESGITTKITAKHSWIMSVNNIALNIAPKNPFALPNTEFDILIEILSAVPRISKNTITKISRKLAAMLMLSAYMG